MQVSRVHRFLEVKRWKLKVGCWRQRSSNNGGESGASSLGQRATSEGLRATEYRVIVGREEPQS